MQKTAGEWLAIYTADPSCRALGRVRWAAHPNAVGKENTHSPPSTREMDPDSLPAHRLVTMPAELPDSQTQDVT